ncbi:hypothetical protein CBM2592_A90097 [Cupriavidus taiwanensis]|nr:hypothetical protein CBM2592_A90097 [Cupriavidus taiwanensis]SOY90703.1 hypothetical protein CBM2591_A90096 [Cupriavidus taiwanensis]SOZ63509.1 hypothetical protein CBM2617_A70073 [Cupriavidus taiwanensis]SOZ82514.1 hypothetical protein CBM2618_A80073 [Cupriavidus taiwanensis]SOZ84394.1 hypothetical protein CBM2622_A80073 [Cupriavidus taiwanensis]
MSDDARAFLAGGAYGLVLALLTFAFIFRHIG